MRVLKIGLFLLFASIAPFVTAQDDDTCPVVVETALEAADSACSEISRNQACYGNVLVDAELNTSVDVTFASVGDIADLSDVESLTLVGYDEATGEWGIAILRVQATIPDTLPGQNVTFVLFGDTEITNNAAEDENPMQAFYFSSGVGVSTCNEAPSGLMVQTPDGIAEVTMTMNGVDVTLGSTAFITVDENDDDESAFTMSFNLLEGGAMVSVGDVSVDVDAGMFTSIPLDDDLNADGDPTDPEPYEAADFEFLPTTLLDEEITIAGMEDADSAAAATGGSVAITPGTWTYNYTEVSGCDVPAGLADQLSGFTIEVSTSDIVEFFITALGVAEAELDMSDVSITNDAENVFTISLSVDGILLEPTFTIVDANTIEFVNVVNDGTCELVSVGTLTNNGG